MRVLIVGGAGYIGSHVAKAFLSRGHEVTVYDNLSSGLRENLLPKSEFVHGEIADELKLRDLIASSGIEAVVHLAAFKAAGESMIIPEKYSRNNIGGTVALLNAMTQTGVGRIVFSSSAAVYGEPEYLPVDEAHPTKPENFYGFTKLEIERLLYWYSKLRGLRYAALRYFNAAGYDPEGEITGLEQNPANLLPVIMEVAVGKRKTLQIFGEDYATEDGTGIRDYIHVTDLAEAHVSAMEYIDREEKDLVVNLGSENGISVREMVEVARRVTGEPIPAKVVSRRPGDPARLVASAGLARELLSWEAHYSDVETLVSTSWKAYRPG
ncbi:MAG: UDP-glucose 4-epimerase GalE [Alkalispirochaetaceae bacterium]